MSEHVFPVPGLGRKRAGSQLKTVRSAALPMFPSLPLAALLGVGLLAGLAGCADTDATMPAASDASAPAQIESAPASPPSQAASATSTGLPSSAAVPAPDSFAAAWGPAIGSTIPLLAANDHTGQARNLASLSGDRGLLLIFSRSADW